MNGIFLHRTFSFARLVSLKFQENWIHISNGIVDYFMKVLWVRRFSYEVAALPIAAGTIEMKQKKKLFLFRIDSGVFFVFFFLLFRYYSDRHRVFSLGQWRISWHSALYNIHFSCRRLTHAILPDGMYTYTLSLHHRQQWSFNSSKIKWFHIQIWMDSRKSFNMIANADWNWNVRERLKRNTNFKSDNEYPNELSHSFNA